MLRVIKLDYDLLERWGKAVFTKKWVCQLVLLRSRSLFSITFANFRFEI